MLDDRLEQFENRRALLTGLAYRMLGSVSDAEDIVQEAWLRWQQAEPADIRSLDAWLTTVVTRLSIDRLRLAYRMREEYVGPWLPEPIATDPTSQPEDRAALIESLSMALLLMLERLSPGERAIFLLREAFEYDYEAIAGIVGKSVAACRQSRRRAGLKLQGAARPPRADKAVHNRLLRELSEAVIEGDVAALTQLFTDDVELWSDGGGKVAAARNVIFGPAHVGRFFAGLRRKAASLPALVPSMVNGAPALLAVLDNKLQFSLTLSLAGDRIERVYIIRNPDKLTHLMTRNNPARLI